MEKLNNKMIQAASILSLTAILCAGCQSGMGSGGTQAVKDNKGGAQAAEEPKEIRDGFTQTELTTGEASFYLTEDICVDAEVTPQERYADGLKSYQIVVYYEAEDGRDIQEFMEEPSFFHKSLGELEGIFSQEIEGSFVQDTIQTEITGEIGYNSFRMSYQTAQEEKYKFFAGWALYPELSDDTDRLYTGLLMYIEPEEENSNMASGAAGAIQTYIPDYREAEVSFLDKEETGKHYKEYLEELMGIPISEEYDCIPVTSELVTELNSVLKEEGFGESYDPSTEECCRYLYYYDVDGFPYVYHYLPYHLQDGQEASPLAKMTAQDATTLCGLANWENEVFVAEDGLISLVVVGTYLPGEVWQEAQEVVSPDHALQHIKDYYSRQVLLEEVMIREVKLVYTGYFGEDEEGIVQPVLQPFWRVKVFQEENNSILYFYYDAFTGDIIEEATTY